MKSIQKLAMLFTAIVLMSFGCQKEEMSPENPEPQSRSFKAYMTDSPADYASLQVEIIRVDAYLEGQGWVTLNNQTRTVNVLSLTNGAQTELASVTGASVSMGVYSMIRIVFGESHHLTLNGQAALDLGTLTGNLTGIVDLQLGGSHEVIVAIDEQVSAQTGAEVLIDFNVAESVHEQAGHYIFNPALSLIERANTGVRGSVHGAATAVITLHNESGSFSTQINAQGEFLLRGMEDGVYELEAIPGRAVGQMQEPQPKVIEGVVVVDGEIASVGTIDF